MDCALVVIVVVVDVRSIPFSLRQPSWKKTSPRYVSRVMTLTPQHKQLCINISTSVHVIYTYTFRDAEHTNDDMKKIPNRSVRSTFAPLWPLGSGHSVIHFGHL